MGIKRYSYIIETTEIYNFMRQVFADEYFQERQFRYSNPFKIPSSSSLRIFHSFYKLKGFLKE